MTQPTIVSQSIPAAASAVPIDNLPALRLDCIRSINLIVVHCTASRCDRHLTPENLDRIHRQRGFNGCGYHYYITREGIIFPMRPLDTIGAHVRGFNAHSIGIAYEGGLQPDGIAADTRTLQQREALCFLIRQLLVLYPKSTVCGHRDLSPDLNGNGIIEPQEWIKQCPCFDASTEYAPICAEAFHQNGCRTAQKTHSSARNHT